MNKKRIYQITPVIITSIGIAYMGYADAKGINNKYGITIVGFGLALSLFMLLFKNKEKSEKN